MGGFLFPCFFGTLVLPCGFLCIRPVYSLLAHGSPLFCYNIFSLHLLIKKKKKKELTSNIHFCGNPVYKVMSPFVWNF